MRAAGRTFSQACNSMSIGLEAVGEQEINSMMKQYDRDGDGTYSIDEVRAMVSVLGQEKKGKKMMTKLACGVFALFLLVLVGNAALTFAVVFLSKDTKPSSSGSLVVTGTSGSPAEAIVSTAEATVRSCDPTVVSGWAPRPLPPHGQPWAREGGPTTREPLGRAH